MLSCFKLTLLLGCLAFLRVMTCAQAYADAAKESVRPSSPDPAFCRALVAHRPDADVAFQPGVDVHGRAIAPADVPGGVGRVSVFPLEIPLTADLATVLNVPTVNFPFNAMKRNDIKLGELTLNEAGKVFYNGQPLSDEQQENLAVVCLRPDKP